METFEEDENENVAFPFFAIHWHDIRFFCMLDTYPTKYWNHFVTCCWDRRILPVQSKHLLIITNRLLLVWHVLQPEFASFWILLTKHDVGMNDWLTNHIIAIDQLLEQWQHYQLIQLHCQFIYYLSIATYDTLNCVSHHETLSMDVLRTTIWRSISYEPIHIIKSNQSSLISYMYQLNQSSNLSHHLMYHLNEEYI